MGGPTVAHGTRWVGLDAARVAALAALDVRDDGDRNGRSPVVMGLDQHRAQITAEWIDLATGEISRGRVAPADRVAVRRFCRGSRGVSSRSRWRRRRAGGSW